MGSLTFPEKGLLCCVLVQDGLLSQTGKMLGECYYYLVMNRIVSLEVRDIKTDRV